MDLLLSLCNLAVEVHEAIKEIPCSDGMIALLKWRQIYKKGRESIHLISKGLKQNRGGELFYNPIFSHHNMNLNFHHNNILVVVSWWWY